jgi:hypothetical protein
MQGSVYSKSILLVIQSIGQCLCKIGTQDIVKTLVLDDVPSTSTCKVNKCPKVPKAKRDPLT